MCNYIDGPTGLNSSPLSPSARLSRLQDHIDRWHTLDWTESRIRLPHGHLYEFSTGVYCIATQDALTALQLPSIIRGTEPQRWTHRGFGFDLIDFTFDPVQDLLILAELFVSPPYFLLFHLLTV